MTDTHEPPLVDREPDTGGEEDPGMEVGTLEEVELAPGDTLDIKHGAEGRDLMRVHVTPPEVRREAADYGHLMEMVAGKEGLEAVEMLERLVALTERAEERDAERALIHAVAAFKAEVPSIPKDAEVDYTTRQGRRIRFRHTRLSTLVRIVDPVLTKHGLSYTWDSEAPKADGLGRVTVCTLRHIGGAFRTATFHSPPAGVEGSAKVQQVGAALTYGQRYSLIMVLGLVSVMDDVDGMGPGAPEDHGEPITDAHLANLQEWIDSTEADTVKLCRFLGVDSLKDLPDARYQEVVEEIQRVGAARKEREVSDAS